MKSLPYCIFLIIALLISQTLPAQDTLYYENFESGGTSITRNTTDLGGTTSGYNQWWMNNVYNGGSGTVICLSFPFSYTIANTPLQPSGIFNNPSSYYLHTLSNAALTNFITNSSFIAADGICVLAESNFAKLNTPFSTANYSSVTLKFWWHCGGGQNVWGELYYSTDGGLNWTQVNTPISQYKNQTNWVQQTIALPAFDNQAQLQFGFRFSNNVTNTAQDPGFSIDDILVTGVAAPPAATIATDSIPGSLSLCRVDTFSVPFTVTGTLQPGNVFTAQLSDAQGSFASPTPIGTLAGTSSGTVTCILPAVSPGTGYRVRVVSSTPAINGVDNGADISIVDFSDITSYSIFPNDTLCSGDLAQIQINSSNGDLSWSYSLDGGQSYLPLPFNGFASISTDPVYATYNNTLYLATAHSAPCVEFNQLLPLYADSISALFSFTSLGNQYSFSDGSFGASSWFWNFGDGDTSALQNPIHTYSGPGSYVVTLVATSAWGCTAIYSDTADILIGMEEMAGRFELEVVPNPVTSAARIKVNLPAPGLALLRILDLHGREIDRLHDQEAPAGEFSTEWHPSASLAEGLYFLELRQQGRSYMHKVLLRWDF